jgi:transmembrane sensor
MESSRQIEDIAADWLTRRDSEAWTEADESRLGEWLNASIAHRVAFVRLEAAWDHALRLQALAAGTQRKAVPPPGEWRVSPFFERHPPVTGADKAARKPHRPSWLAIAASILLLIGLGIYVSPSLWGEGYATPVGGVSSIPLSDGSSITLNTASKIRVDLSKDLRRIELERGEAFFDVAKDPARPFIVEAGTKRIVAVGTQFSVRRNGEEVQVVVTQGKVRVDSALLGAGAFAKISKASLLVQRKTQREAEDTTSWRRGFLTFDATPLGDAIAEFNRYTLRKIEIHDSQVGALRISGKFRPANAEAFIRVLRDGFAIQAQETDERIILGAPVPRA